MLKCLNAQRGVSIYLAIIIMVVVLSIGLGISTLLVGQIKTMKGMRYSVVAFYAADTGVERALFNVRKNDDKTSQSDTLDNGSSYTFSFCLGKIQSIGSYKGVRRAIETQYTPPKFAFVAADTVDLQVINVTDITGSCGPELSGSYDYGNHGEDVFIDDSIGYLADGSGGLKILNIQDSGSVQLITTLPLPHYAATVVAYGNYVFVGGGPNLSSINVSNPSAPFIEDTIAGPGSESVRESAIDKVNNRIYVAVDFDGIWIVDITNPAAPVLVDLVDTPGRAWGIAAYNNLVYVADVGGGLRLIDPSIPGEVGFYQDVGFNASGVFVIENRAYIAAYDKLRIVDASSLLFLGDFLPMENATDVNVINNVAYVTDEIDFQAGLRIIDVSDPASTNSLGEISFAGLAYRLFVK